MAVYGFNDLYIAQNLKRIGMNGVRTKTTVDSSNGTDTGSRVFLVRTLDGEEIPAAALREEDTHLSPGSAQVEVLQILERSGPAWDLKPRARDGEEPVLRRIFNFKPFPIAPQDAVSGANTVLLAVEDSFGKLIAVHPEPPCWVSYYGTPAEIPENTPWDAAVANRAGWSYNATRETFEENGTLPPFRNPLQLPLDAPLLVMNLAGCGPTAVSCSPFRMIYVNEDTTNLNVGDVFQEGWRLFAVKVKPPSGTHSGRLYAPVACKPIEECFSDEVTKDSAADMYQIDGQNHRMAAGIGPWTIEAGYFVYRTQYFGTAMYAPNFHAGMVLWNGHEVPLSFASVQQGASMNLVPDLYHGDSVEVCIEVYQESNAWALRATFLSGPLDHRPGTILYALNQPGRGWTRVDPPDSYKQSSKNACVPAFCLDGTWLSDGASHQIQLPDSTTSTTFNFTVLGSFWQKQQSPDM